MCADFTDSEIFIKSYEEALKKNEKTLNGIKTFKKELEDVRTNLQSNKDHLYQNIMVPIGSKAFMKGKLVHTNEVTINVGDRWFIKKSAASAIETCNRMIERCDQNLAEYEKESHLLCSNLDIPSDYEIFATGDVQEIVEPYDEESEKQWRENHREKVRKYKQQEAANRKDEKELFKRLEQLEELEESEHNEDDVATDDSDDDEDSDYDDEEINEEEYDELIEQSIKLNEEIPKSAVSATKSETNISEKDATKKSLKKRVSFSDSLESTQEYSTAALEDEIDIIRFKHGESKKTMSELDRPANSVNSPADIYKKFIFEQENIDRKSILKKASSITNDKKFSSEDVTNENNSYESNKMEKVQKSIIKIKKNTNDVNASILLDEISSDEVFGDIVEKTPDTLPKITNSNRPVSKFKKSRISGSSNT